MLTIELPGWIQKKEIRAEPDVVVNIVLEAGAVAKVFGDSERGEEDAPRHAEGFVYAGGRAFESDNCAGHLRGNRSKDMKHAIGHGQMDYRTGMRRIAEPVSIAVLCLVVAAGVIGLWPELSIARVDLNDNVSHIALIERIVETVEHGGNPLDAWSPEWTFGFPMLRVYQPLAHLLVAAVYFALGKSVALMTVFVWVRFLAVVLTPVSFYAAARLMEFDEVAAVACAVAAPLISSSGLFGLEYGSYVWAGNGLFPQSVAVHLLLFALGLGFRAVRLGRGYVAPGVLLGLTFVAHLIYGYMGAVSLAVLAVLPGDKTALRARVTRLMKLGAVSAGICLFQLLPLAIDGPIVNHSRWEAAWKWDGYGAAGTLGYLFRGEVLDANRWPVLSLVAAGGLVVVLWRWRSTTVAQRFAPAGFVLWTMLLFGRPFWDGALWLFGISPDMQLHRVAAGMQLFAVLLIGVAFGAMWRYRRALAIVAAIAVAAPAAVERGRYLANNARWGRENLAAYAGAEPALNAVIGRVREIGGRVYTGVPAGWGGQHKIASVPFFAFLSVRQVPAVAYLYHAMALTAEIQPRLDEWRIGHYQLFGIRSVVAPAGIQTALPPFWHRDQTIGRFDVFTIPNSGYFDVVDVSEALRVDKSSFYDVNDRWLAGPDVERRRHLLLEIDGSAGPVSDGAGAAGAIVDERESGGEYRADADLSRPAYVLFKMTWHPNWHAWVDGAQVKTAMLSPGFAGVPVPAGRHRVRFEYEGSAWRVWLALAGVVGVAGVRVWARR
jgi:hypothetical protein